MAYYDITVYPGETLRVAYNSHPAKETSLRIMRRRTIIHYINPMFPKDDYIFTLEATSQDTLRIEVKVKKKPDGHHKWHRYHTWIGHQQFTKDSTFVQTIMFDIEQCEDEDDLSHSAFRGRIGIRNGERVG